MGIGAAAEIIEEIIEGLPDQPMLQILPIGHIESAQAAGNQQIIAQPEQKTDGDHDAGSVVQGDGRFVGAKEVDVIGETDLRPGGGQGDDAEGIEPVPDPHRRRGQVDPRGLFHWSCSSRGRTNSAGWPSPVQSAAIPAWLDHGRRLSPPAIPLAWRRLASSAEGETGGCWPRIEQEPYQPERSFGSWRQLPGNLW